MTHLDVLQNKIEQLLQKYDQLLEENTGLKKVIAAQTQNIEQLNGTLAELELRLLNQNEITENNKTKDIKEQLDKIIMEVDKITDSINE